MRRTKIICTLGPASSSEEVMEKMLLSGMNVARLNFSHGSHESHREIIARFRRVRDRLGLPAAVMLDTKGPEIRLGVFSAPVSVQPGDPFVFTSRDRIGDRDGCQITYAGLTRDVKPGNTILVDDGELSFRVEECTDTDIRCTVVDGGTLSDRKGVNVPGVALDMPFLSEKDKSDLLFGIQEDVDFVAASFTRRKEDIIALREFLVANGGPHIHIIAKIENSEGVEKFQEILAHADGIMVARGDMGVEVPFELLPGLQKRFIRACCQSGKVAITATQMLDSMEENRRPTRAEISDVANAVFDGTSAVMLSGETAAGKYPAEAVAVMARIAQQAEGDAFASGVFKNMWHVKDITDNTNAVSAAACTTADQLGAKAIIADTTTGKAARRVSKFRPRQRIVAATPMLKTFHQLSLSWGVYPLLTPDAESVDDLFAGAIDASLQAGLIHRGETVVLTAGIPLHTRGSTNMLKVQTVE